MLGRQLRESVQVRRIAGHRVHTVHRDHAGVRVHRVAHQFGQMIGVVMAEADDRGPVARRIHGTVVDRLVCAPVQEDRPVSDQDRDHRGVDVGDRGQDKHVLAAQELGRLLFDLRVHRRAPEEARPRWVRTPLGEVLGDRRDDLGLEVEAEVVARREVRQPLIADADPATPLLVDDGVHHRVRGRQARQVGNGRYPAVEPAVVRAPARLAVGRRLDGDVGDAPNRLG